MAFPFEASFIADKFAKVITVKTVTLEDLADICANTVSPSKDAQPFWKLGLYGSNRLANGCLRHDANFEAANGIEVDCDGQMPFDEAKARLEPHGLAFLLHTTVSHTALDPHWRGIFIFSKSLPPGDRARMVSRINGILGGCLAKESWALSTAFKYGSVIGQPDCEIYVSDGEEFVDERDDLDTTAMPFRAQPGQAGKGGKLDFENMDEAELYDAIQSGEHGWRPAKFLIDLWEEQNIPESDAIANLEAAFDAVPAANRRPKWAQQRANIPRWVKTGYERATKRKGKFFSALVDYFENGPLFKNTVRLNRFARRVEVANPFPPQPGQIQPGQTVDYRALEDPADTLEAVINVQANGFPKTGKNSVFDALFLTACRHAAHPVRDYLNSLKWDGVKRLDRLLLDYIPGFVPDDPDRGPSVLTYLEAIGPCFMIGAVARIFQPGCKVDNLVVLISPQGRNKSKALAALVPDPGWFTDDVPANISDKDSKLALDGKWVVELAEFPHLRREIDRVKAFFSRATDRYRPPYARLVADWPRQCVFIGTVNELELPDVTGNRRFWPVLLDGPVDDEAIARDRDMLWAEAVHRYREGEKWWLSPEVEKIAAEVQDDYVESDVRDEVIAAWIDTVTPKGDTPRFTVREVLEHALGFAIDAKTYSGDDRRPLATAADEKRVIRRLRRLGYQSEPHQTKQDGKRYRFWIPIGP